MPWSLKPRAMKPPITIWADGKVKDEILEKINRERGTNYGRKKFTRRMAHDIERCAYQNAKDQQAA